MGKEKKEIFAIQKRTALGHSSIGICGCSRGCGVTHLAIALTNYCASKLRRPTACLELNRTRAFSSLSGFVPKAPPRSAADNRSCFSIYDADYYPEVSGAEIPAICNAGYSCLLLDFGVLTEENLGEFLRCGKKLVVGSLAPWKEDDYREFLRNSFMEQSQRKSFDYLALFGNGADVRRFSGSARISMRQIPFIGNPFHIEKEQFPFLEGLL